MAEIHSPIPSLKLNDGTSMPMIAYGTGSAWYKREAGEVDRIMVEAVKTAIKLGYTHLDGAEVYKTETELGLGIKESGVPREKLYLVTKVNEGIKDIEGSLRASLKKLQVDYVDLYLIHSPFFSKSDADLQKAWADMEAVQALGLTKSIGVSNFLPQHLNPLLATAKVIPVCNQIEFHPYLQHPQLLTLHKEHKIATTAYGPLSAVTKGAPGPVDDYIAALAKKYAVSAGEISLRWCIDQDVVAITTSAKETRLSDYLRATTFKLMPREVEEINKLGAEKHHRVFWRHIFSEDDRS